MEGPERRDGYWVWAGSGNGAEVCFVGRGPRRPLAEVLEALGAPAGSEPAWAKQVHSARVLEARPGLAGEGDALWTRRVDLALAVATADCVPVLLAGGGVTAAIHAGWRGIAAGVVEATLEALDADRRDLAAWIGPAIGPCCYEVGADVAARVAAASDPAVVREGPGDRPHLDLAAAVRSQLARAGVEEARTAAGCTRCDADRLFSYRRQGEGAGRNLALIWRSADAPAPPGDRGRTPAAGRRRR